MKGKKGHLRLHWLFLNSDFESVTLLLKDFN